MDLANEKSKSDDEVQKLNAEIIETTLRYPGLEEYIIPKLSDKGNGCLEAMKFDGFPKNKIKYLKNFIKKIQTNKKAKEIKNAKLNSLLS